MEGLTYFLHLFHSGGIVMYPLLALSIFTVAIAIERFCYYKANRKDSKRFFTGIDHAVKNQQWDAVDVFCKKIIRLLVVLLPMAFLVATAKKK